MRVRPEWRSADRLTLFTDFETPTANSVDEKNVTAAAIAKIIGRRVSWGHRHYRLIPGICRHGDFEEEGEADVERTRTEPLDRESR